MIIPAEGEHPSHGSTEASQCSLQGYLTHRSIFLHLPTCADLRCGCLGPGNTVYGDAGCDYSHRLRGPQPGFPRRTVPDSAWVTRGEPMQSSGWPKPPLPL